MGELQYSRSSLRWGDPENLKMSRKKAMEYRAKGFLVQNAGARSWHIKLVHVFVVLFNGITEETVDMREQISHYYRTQTITEAVYQRFEYDATNHLITFEIDKDGKYKIV